MSVNASDLAKLYPLDSLRTEHLEQVAKESTLEEFGKGTALFKAGDTDEQTIYVLSGVIQGEYPDGKIKKTDASSLQGRYALFRTRGGLMLRVRASDSALAASRTRA